MTKKKLTVKVGMLFLVDWRCGNGKTVYKVDKIEKISEGIRRACVYCYAVDLSGTFAYVKRYTYFKGLWIDNFMAIIRLDCDYAAPLSKLKALVYDKQLFNKDRSNS